MLPSKNDLLKVGIVGCGSIANLQLRYITKYIRPENIALCDTNRLRMNWLSDEFKIKNAFSNLQTTLDDFKPDVVHVLTPPKTHKDIAVRCLSKGCHVFIEKPMCISTEEAEEIIKAAREAKRLVCVDHMRLLDPRILKVKNILNSGEVGNIVSISTTEVGNYLVRKREGLTAEWMHELPGEFFFDILPHHLSLLNEFIPELKITGVAYQKDKDNNITDLHCLFNSPHGTGLIHLSLTAYLENSIIFEGTKGIICVDFLNRIVVVRKATGLPSIIERVWDKINVCKQLTMGIINFLVKRPDNLAGMDNLIRRFYKSIAEDGKSPIPGENGLHVMRLVEDVFLKIPRRETKDFVGKEHSTAQLKQENQLRKCNILVTGGTGFIGRKLVNRLISEGNRIRILTHRDFRQEELASFFSGQVEIFKGNISNAIDVENACKGIETVYHLAAATKGNWLYHLDTTVAGTHNIIAACIAIGVKNMIYVSTIAVLNTTKCNQGGVIDEDFPYEENPARRGNYSTSKLMAEKFVRKFMEDPDARTRVSIVRPGIVYGPGKDPLLGILARLTKKVSVAIEYKKRMLPLVYVENLVDALALAGNAAESGIYNVVDEHVTVKEFVRACKRASGEKFMVIYLPLPFLRSTFWMIDKMAVMLLGKPSFWLYNLKAKGHRHIYSTQRIENCLGWNPRIKVKEALGETMS